MIRRFALSLSLALPAFGPAYGHDAKIESAVQKKTNGQYSFSVTLAHAETGWDDYADGWRVELEDGTVLGTRILAHPHSNEQPFTRSLSRVEVPEGITIVFIRAKTLADGWAEERFKLLLN